MDCVIVKQLQTDLQMLLKLLLCPTAQNDINIWKLTSGNAFHIMLLCCSIFSGCINVDLVQQCIAKLKKGKAPGLDGLMAEHILLAHPIIAVHLSLLFNVLLTHGVVPDGFARGVVIAIILLFLYASVSLIVLCSYSVL